MFLLTESSPTSVKAKTKGFVLNEKTLHEDSIRRNSATDLQNIISVVLVQVCDGEISLRLLQILDVTGTKA